MITAIDTSVLLDVFIADPVFGEPSKNALRLSLREGSLVACEVVWAETGSFFPSSEAAEAALSRLGVEFSSLERRTSLAAGEAWAAYRGRGGKRQRVIADFLIGSHAACQADRLLTRDRGFYRAYFRGLELLEPS